MGHQRSSFLFGLVISGIVASATLGVIAQHQAYAHGDESRVSLELEADAAIQAGDFAFSFNMIDSKNRSLIADRDLSVVHEKKLHLFIFDPALKEFRHEHPEYTGSAWQVKVNLPVSGNYWVWAQGQFSADGEEFTASTRLEVKGGAPANPIPDTLGDVRTGNDGASIVTVSKTRLVAGKMAMLDLAFSRKDGSAPQITPFLGAPAHVVGVLSDGDTFIHVHPMDHGTPGHLMLHAAFPEAGDYRLWVQFQDAGELRTIPLSVKVYSR